MNTGQLLVVSSRYRARITMTPMINIVIINTGTHVGLSRTDLGIGGV